MLVAVARIVPVTAAEGPGRRFALWFQGCPLRCAGCCNPEMLSFSGGGKIRLAEILELISAAALREIEGITLLGGEPLAHAEAAARLARADHPSVVCGRQEREWRASRTYRNDPGHSLLPRWKDFGQCQRRRHREALGKRAHHADRPRGRGGGAGVFATGPDAGGGSCGRCGAPLGSAVRPATLWTLQHQILNRLRQHTGKYARDAFSSLADGSFRRSSGEVTSHRPGVHGDHPG